MSSNVYYSPENLGLTVFGQVDDGADYEFDIFAVWQDANGTLYWAADSGCSCPCPFEDYNILADLSTGTPVQCREALSAWSENGYHYGGRLTSEVTELLAELATLR